MMLSTLLGVSAARVQRSGRYCTALFMFLLAAALFTFGQGGTATIVGTVTDSSGAALPNVAITSTHVETGEVRSGVTNEAGQYTLPSLPIGHYNLDVKANGFGPTEKKNIVLEVDDRSRIDFALKVGGTQENITVEANAVAVQTETGEVSGVINGEDLTQLATNGRSIYTLVNLTPGVSNIQGDFIAPTSITGDQNVSINGSRPINNLYMIDGGEDNDRGGGGYDVLPSLDAIAEFRTLTSNYSAEYGLTAGGVITQVFKSGTQQLHASAWEFVRNDALDARNYFNPAPQPVTELRYNTYGFNVGGQVPLWKSHPTFFFYNMEWRSLINGGSLNQNFPATSSYGGDFTQLTTPETLANLHAPATCQLSTAQQANFAAAGQPLSGCTGGAPDPTLQVPFVTAGIANVINPALLDSNAQALLAAGIFPTTDNSGVFHGGANSPTNVREEIVRIDHTFTSKFSVFGHFVAEQATIGFGTTQWSGDNSPSVGDTMGNPSYSAVVHTTYVISPTLLNEASYNYNGNRINIIPTGVLAAPGFNFNRIFSGPQTNIPSINLGNNPGAGGDYTSNWTPWTNIANGSQIRDDLSWTKGTHQIKMGASWALWKKAQTIFTTPQGNFDFSAAQYTGNGFSDFLLGYSGGYSEDAIKDSGQYNNVSWAAYVQDNWRVNKQLTLNLGLRWDGAPHTYEANDRLGNFYQNLFTPVTPAQILAPGNSSILPGAPGLGTSPNPILAGTPIYLNGIGIPGHGGVPNDVVDNHWAAFGPRIGFAYDPTGAGKTVVRGGFGVNYSRIQGNDMYNAGGNSPFNATSGLNNVLLSNPKTSVLTNATLTAPIPVVDLTGMDQTNSKLPVTYQYSLGVQRALGPKSVLSVSYVGNESRHLNDYRQINLPAYSDLPNLVTTNNANSVYNTEVPYVGFRSIRMSEDEANGNYNSLQTNLHATLRNDLTFQFGYTYSKAMDPTASSGSGADLSNVSNPYVGWRYDYGPSIYDRTHVAFINFVYDLPIFRNSANHLLKSTVGGWQLSGIVTLESGAPINIVLGGTSAGSIVQQSSNRPDVVAPISTPHTVAQWFDPSDFAAPAAGTWGDLGHNAIRGPGRDNWNLSLFKTFAFSERAHFEFRAETFNTWNHTQFRGDQNGSNGNGIDTGTTDSRFGQITAAYDPRVFQFGAKLIF